jgi:hypothetical protein
MTGGSLAGYLGSAVTARFDHNKDLAESGISRPEAAQGVHGRPDAPLLPEGRYNN